MHLAMTKGHGMPDMGGMGGMVEWAA